MSNGLLVSRTNKLKLAKKCFENPSDVNISAYKMFRNLYNSLIRSSKKLYYAKILELNASNPLKKSAKNTISEIISNDINVNNSFEITQKFNELFTSIATTFSGEINPSDTDIDISPITDCRFDMSLSPVSIEELDQALGSLQDKKTPDLNNISMHLLKKVINLVKTPLIHIFSRSLSSGIVPDKMKIAKVVPIFKSGSHTDINNYRPISLLCSFSKILEKIVAGRLLKYLNSNNLISPNQFGFRAKHATVHPKFKLINSAANAINNKKFFLVIFCDLRKAFDTCNINILLKKLSKLGIQGAELAWFKSYLNPNPHGYGI
jgi:hypothetical protein